MVSRFRRASRPRATMRGPNRGVWVFASALLLAVSVSPFAFAAGEGNALLGGRRNPSNNASVSLSRETEIIASSTTYGTRQSNKRNGDGGGAIYGCRSAPGREPCLRGNNLNTGRAFEFETRGPEGGRFQVGGPTTNPTAVPFSTNAQGRVANLNADRVDNLEADQIVAQARPLAAVVADDALSRGNGATGASRVAEGDFTVTFNRDVSACTYVAAIGEPGTDTPAPGEIGVARREGNPNAVRVVTRDSAGVLADRDFHLTVNC